jgi:hypothetical protein
MTIRIKSLGAPSLPEEVWTIHSGGEYEVDADKLYSTVSWLYRCVTIRGNSIASMPFEIRQGEEVVYEYDGITPQNTPPKDLNWILDWPELAGKVEIASILGGEAYIGRMQNVLGGDMPLRWYLPWSVEPVLNGVTSTSLFSFDSSLPHGSLQGFLRRDPKKGTPRRLEIEDVLYFWYPDHSVEIGAAKNYPGKSVMQNAGVIGALDLFLKGYFERGMVKATLLKYKNQLSNDEAKRVKEWWRRVFTSVKNAFATEVVRGDFETMEIGDGVKDLRDNVLTKDERDAIAVGLGVPPSKLLPVGVNKATKDGDDRGYVEDTVIPEIIWIYSALNRQMLNDMGYSIVALPQQLRVMQTDEVERSRAAKNYFDMGYAKREIENILGIYVPDEIKEQVANEVARREVLEKSSQIDSKHLFVEALDYRDEKNQYLRWLKKRGVTTDISQFETKHLSDVDKNRIFVEWVESSEIENMIDDFADTIKKLQNEL